MTWTVPNILTALRLLAAPGVAVMFLYFTRPYADWFALLLFVGAAVTDWFDGYLARLWKQETRLGKMLDPIADKAMVVIALMVDTAGYLKVTAMAKWKTTAQMIAIAVLFSQGVFEHYLIASSWGMDRETFNAVLSGDTADEVGIVWKYHAMIWAGRIGIVLLWIAAALTLVTGWEYFRKATPYLRDEA